jgi:hypothetical protein
MGRRIETKPEESALFLGADTGVTNKSGGDGYIDRLLKYIPAEIIALYLGAANVVPVSDPSHPHQQEIATWAIAALAALATPLYLYITTRKKGAPNVWSQIIIGSIAFPVWVFAIGGPFEMSWPSWYRQERWIGAIVIMFGTFLAALYEPDESTRKDKDKDEDKDNDEVNDEVKDKNVPLV